MGEETTRYEVIFTLDSAAPTKTPGSFLWSWVQIGHDDLVTVRSSTHASLRDAIDDAAAYRRRHGGGQIRVNIQGTEHRDAQGAVYLS
jgi:hypothetical protein